MSLSTSTPATHHPTNTPSTPITTQQLNAAPLPSTPYDPSQHAGPSSNGHSTHPIPETDPLEIARKEARDEWDEHVVQKRKQWRGRGFDEQHMDDLESVTLSHRMALYQDQLDVLFPAPPTAFTSTQDAVERLLPYHVYQQWDCELDSPEAHMKETRKIEASLALSIDKVSERFFKIRRKGGTQPSHLPALIPIIESTTASIRQQVDVLKERHRKATTEWSAIQSLKAQKARNEAAEKAAAEAAEKRRTDAMRAEEDRKRLEQQKLLKKHQDQQEALLAKSKAKEAKEAKEKADAKKANGTGKKGRAKKEITDDAPVASGSTSPMTPVPTTAPSAPATPNATNATSTATTATPAPASAGVPKGPVSISVPMPLISQFVSLGIIKVPSDPNTPTPGTIVRTTADRKNAIISLRLGSCTKVQLQGMAKALNVKITTPDNPAASGTSVEQTQNGAA